MYFVLTSYTSYPPPPTLLIRRYGSRDMLSGKPNGTFLVRPKGNVEESSTMLCHTHTIDIV